MWKIINCDYPNIDYNITIEVDGNNPVYILDLKGNANISLKFTGDDNSDTEKAVLFIIKKSDNDNAILRIRDVNNNYIFKQTSPPSCDDRHTFFEFRPTTYQIIEVKRFKYLWYLIDINDPRTHITF